MDTSSSALLTGVVVTGGKWAKGEGLSPMIVFKGVFLAIGLALLSQANEKLAQQFALLILVGASLTYAIPIIEKSGIAK